MIKIENKKGFEIFQIDTIDRFVLGWGNVCCECNGLITDEKDSFYVAALNDVMHKKCLEEWYNSAVYYTEDAEFEKDRVKSMKNVMRKLNLLPADISIMDIGLDK